MKLQELAAPKQSTQIAKVFESYFGSRITLDQLNARQTGNMLSRVRGLIKEHQTTPHRHYSEQNPSYLKLVMLEQALASKLAEVAPPVPGQPAQPGQPGQPEQQDPAAAQKAVAQVKDPKLAAALKKSQAGQTLNPEEQKMVAGAALMKAENRLRSAFKIIKESEVQQAQVVLAAQDMVDKMQAMLEDTTEMQFKELPALVDSIRNQIGMDQAMQFNTDASAALAGLVQNLQGAKQQLEQALGVVTGTAQATPALDGALAGAEAGAELGADAGAELGAEAGAELGAEAGAEELPPEPEEEPLGAKALGRARR
jgi:hypothetical protein